MLDMKELAKGFNDALAKIEAAKTALDEVKGKEKPDETEVKEAEKLVTEAEAEFDELSAKMPEAEANAKRVAVQKRAAELAGKAGDASDKLADAATGVIVTDPAEHATVKDYVAEEKARVEAFRAFMADEEGDLPDEKRDLIAPKSKTWDKSLIQADPKRRANRKGFQGGEAVLPPSIAAAFLGGQAVIDPIRGKVVTSLDDAVNNPSLAHYLVPEEFKAQLLQLPAPPPTLLSQVTRVATDTGELTYPQLTQTDSNEFGGVAFTWTEEAHEKGETEPQFEQVTIAAHELSGYTELSDRVISRSAIALEPLLRSLYRSRLNYEVDRVILNGSGDGKPLGLLNTAGVHRVGRAGAGAVVWADIVNLCHAVQYYHRMGARYCMGDPVEQSLALQTDGDGRPLFTASVAYGPYDRIYGRPYDVAYHNPALGSEGDIVFGNWRYYFLVVEEEITIAKSTEYRFRRNRTAFKVFLVMGGRAVQPRAFAYLVGVGGS